MSMKMEKQKEVCPSRIIQLGNSGKFAFLDNRKQSTIFRDTSNSSNSKNNIQLCGFKRNNILSSIRQYIPALPQYLYHGTSVAIAALIDGSGLGGSYTETSRLTGLPVVRNRDVWFAESRSKAVGSGGSGVVYRVDTTVIGQANFTWVREGVWKFRGLIPRESFIKL